MAFRMANIAVPATQFLLIVNFIIPVISTVPPLIPAEKTALTGWFNSIAPSFKGRHDTAGLDPELVAAENGVKVIKVRQDGTGDFKTVTDAVNSVPEGNTKRVVIWIGKGVYKEKILVKRTQHFITFYGSALDMPKLTFNGDANTFGTLDSATVAVESNYFIASNIIFENSSPEPDGKRVGAQAVAMRISGDKAAFYNCRFIGFQDTLCDDRGDHLFKDCYIEGTVDFIFGDGTSLYLATELRSVSKQGGVITAHAREKDEETSGYAFVHCKISGQKNTHLGRVWKAKARVVYLYTDMGDLINPEGWEGMGDNKGEGVYYGEYKCTGAGASLSSRVKFVKKLTDEEAKPFLNLEYIKGSSWILPPPKLS